MTVQGQAWFEAWLIERNARQARIVAAKIRESGLSTATVHAQDLAELLDNLAAIAEQGAHDGD